MNFLLYAFLSIVSIAFSVFAEDKNICHNSQKYLIIEQSTGEVGTNFLVKFKLDSNQLLQCKYIVEKGDFEIKNEEAEYFLALQGDLLILDSGTGPDPRGLIIWNLHERKKVYSGDYSEPIEIKSGYLEFWMETEKATNENCPELKKWESDGLGAAIEGKVRLNLFDFSIVKSSQIRCNSRQ
jgi:hypothetical protein